MLTIIKQTNRDDIVKIEFCACFFFKLICQFFESLFFSLFFYSILFLSLLLLFYASDVKIVATMRSDV